MNISGKTNLKKSTQLKIINIQTSRTNMSWREETAKINIFLIQYIFFPKFLLSNVSVTNFCHFVIKRLLMGNLANRQESGNWQRFLLIQLGTTIYQQLWKVVD